MKIAIVDDLAEERTAVRQLINEYLVEKKINDITPIFIEFKSGEDFLESYSPFKYQFIFLDIYMDKLSGIEVANNIVSEEKNSNIVLVTSSEDHMLEGFEVRALGYVLKPIIDHKNQLFKAFAYGLEKLSIDTSSIMITTTLGEYNLCLRDLIYLEISTRFLYIHTPKNTMKIIGKYSDHKEELLNDIRFIECNRNLIVNLDYVSALKNSEFILKSDVRLPISRRKKRQVTEQYMTHFMKGIRD